MGLYALQFIPLRVQRSSAVLKGFNAPLTEFKQFTIMDVGTVGRVATKVTLVILNNVRQETLSKTTLDKITVREERTILMVGVVCIGGSV